MSESVRIRREQQDEQESFYNRLLYLELDRIIRSEALDLEETHTFVLPEHVLLSVKRSTQSHITLALRAPQYKSFNLYNITIERDIEGRQHVVITRDSASIGKQLDLNNLLSVLEQL